MKQFHTPNNSMGGTGKSVLPCYVENSLCVSCTDLAVYFQNILQNSSCAIFCEVRVLLEKYAQLLFRQSEFEL